MTLVLINLTDKMTFSFLPVVLVSLSLMSWRRLGQSYLGNKEELKCIMSSFRFSDSFLVAHPESFFAKTHKFSVPANGYIAYIFYFFHHFNENFLKRLPGLGSE